MWWSVGRSWIPANSSLPSFWWTKKSNRRRRTGFGFSGLFHLPFLSCLNKFFVRRTLYFLCCSTTRIWLWFQASHSADFWWSESLSRNERRKNNRTEWWLIASLFEGRMVHRSSSFVLCGQRKIIWSEDILVKMKEACRQEAIRRYFACCSSLVCISE